MKNLPGVQAIVENLQGDVVASGLDKNVIQTDVELLLRSVGIKVLTLEETAKISSSPTLYVNVNTTSNGRLTAFCVHLEVQQVVTLKTGEEFIGAVTWEKATVGAVEMSEIHRIRDALKDLVAMFANDFLAVNPK